MKREIRKKSTHIDNDGYHASDTYTLEEVANTYLLPPLSQGLFLLFDQINQIETTLDKLISSLEKPEDCERFLDKIEIAKNLAKTRQTIFQLHKDYRTNDRVYNSIVSQVFLSFLHEFNEMMVDICEMGSQAKVKLYEIKANQAASNFSLERIVLPSIENYVSLASVELRDVLLQENVDPIKLDALLKRNASMLSNELYNEKDSVLAKKYHGMSEHYMQTLKVNDELTHIVNQNNQEKAKLQAENKSLLNYTASQETQNNKLISRLKDLEIASRINAEQLRSLSSENSALKKQIGELSQNLAKINTSANVDKKQSENKNHHHTFLSSFRKKS